jgi:hypothetical protein
MSSNNKMAPNSKRIGWSKETFPSHDDARRGAEAYMAALEPKFQAGRSFKVTKWVGIPGLWAYDVYLGDRPRETYQSYSLRLDAWQAVALESLVERCMAGETMPDINKESLAVVLAKLQAALSN